MQLSNVLNTPTYLRKGFKFPTSQLFSISLVWFIFNKVFNSSNPFAHNIEVEVELCRSIDTLSIVCTLRQQNNTNYNSSNLT